MQNVEFVVVTFPPYALEHFHMQCVGIADRAIEPQRLRPSGVELA